MASYNPSIRELRQKDLREFEARLGYISKSKPAYITLKKNLLLDCILVTLKTSETSDIIIYVKIQDLTENNL